MKSKQSKPSVTKSIKNFITGAASSAINFIANAASSAINFITGAASSAKDFIVGDASSAMVPAVSLDPSQTPSRDQTHASSFTQASNVFRPF